MSRPPQSAVVDASQAQLEEEEVVSGTAEGDEVMEEAEEQEGYSKSSCTYSQQSPTFQPPLFARFTPGVSAEFFSEIIFAFSQLHRHRLRH
jgi:hypothetical protein